MGDQVDALGPPASERRRARAGRGADSSCGATGRWWGSLQSRLELPLPGPGVYRVEAWLPGWPVPWVVTNPVYVFDAATREARRQRAAWPGPPAPPRESAPLTFASESRFTAEHDSAFDDGPAWSSTPRAGPGGAEAFRLGFRSGATGPGAPFTWCALVNREAAGPRRVERAALQGPGGRRVPALGPAARPEPGLGRRRPRVVDGLGAHLDRVERGAAPVQPASARSTRRATAGSTPDETRAVVFMLDHASVKPGTKGTIWFADVGVYRSGRDGPRAAGAGRDGQRLPAHDSRSAGSSVNRAARR